MNEPPRSPFGRGHVATDAANEEPTPAMRLMELMARHRGFPYQNQILLQRLKKEKLRLKDTIEHLKDDLIPDLNA